MELVVFRIPLLIFFWLISPITFSSVSAQCPDGEIVINSLQDLEEYELNYSSCTEWTSPYK